MRKAALLGSSRHAANIMAAADAGYAYDDVVTGSIARSLDVDVLEAIESDRRRDYAVRGSARHGRYRSDMRRRQSIDAPRLRCEG